MKASVATALLFAALSSGCAGALKGGTFDPFEKPQVAQPGPPATLRAVAVLVNDQAGRPVVGARCSLQDVPGWTPAVTSDAVGYLVWLEVTTGLGPTAVRCHAENYIDYEASAVLTTSTNETLPSITLKRNRVDLPRLVLRGRVFGLETGERFTVIAASDFNLLARFLQGEDIEPILAQRAGAGFNTLRVWTRYDLTIPPPIGRLTMGAAEYAGVPAFLQALARHGLYAELTGYAGWNTYDNGQHGARLCAAIQGQTNVTFEWINEWDNNNIDGDNRPVAMPPGSPCQGIVSSHGSNASEHEPVMPFWDYTGFHTNGANEWWRKTGHNAMEQGDLPVVSNENTRFPDNDDNPAHAFDAAAGAALLAAGSTFHSTAGKPSVLWDAPQLALAQAWAAGARSVPLDCQDGGYKHRSDLEGDPAHPTFLRVYQHGDDPRCIVRIRP